MAGCAADSGPYPEDQGWRIAVVEAEAPPDSAPGNGCDGVPPLARSVYVRYAAGMRPRRTVVAIPSGEHWKPGQRLRFNLADCSRAAAALPDVEP